MDTATATAATDSTQDQIIKDINNSSDEHTVIRDSSVPLKIHNQCDEIQKKCDKLCDNVDNQCDEIQKKCDIIDKQYNVLIQQCDEILTTKPDELVITRETILSDDERRILNQQIEDAVNMSKMLKRSNKLQENIMKAQNEIIAIQNGSIKDIPKSSPPPKTKTRKRTIDSVEETTKEIKKECKKRKTIPKITRAPCPSCMSWKNTGFMYSTGKEEWIYACRETNLANDDDDICGNMWIESDRCPMCKCKCGGYVGTIDIRKQKPGYYCKDCNAFKAF